MVRATTPRRHPAALAERWRRAGPAESASALALVPALLLVFICLGGMAIDLSLVHGAHRSAHRVVSGAADDAASMIDTNELQLTGELRIDRRAAERVALAHLQLADLPGQMVGTPVIDVDADAAVVTVQVDLDVDHVMLRALPGHPDHQQIHVEASARLNR